MWPFVGDVLWAQQRVPVWLPELVAPGISSVWAAHTLLCIRTKCCGPAGRGGAGVEPLFPLALWLSSVRPTGFKAQVPGSSSQSKAPRWVPNMGLRSLSLWGGPLKLGFPSCLWVAKPGLWVLMKAHLHPPNHLTETPYFYIFDCGLFSASLQVIHIDSYSVNCCNFAVAWEEVSSGPS